eukprot:g355.t1
MSRHPLQQLQANAEVSSSKSPYKLARPPPPPKRGPRQNLSEMPTPSAIKVPQPTYTGSGMRDLSMNPPAPMSPQPNTNMSMGGHRPKARSGKAKGGQLSPGGSTISHSILATHGATSEVFLQHLQQTWELHQQMQTENRDNQARAAEMEREMDALRNALESSRRSESESQKKLQALKVSNESITKEVSLMRSQLEKVTQSAAAVQDRYRSERAKFEGKEATQQRTIDALSARIADESDRHCQTARQLAQAESIAKEARVQLAAFEDAKKQLRAAQLTEEQLSAHIEKLVGELKTSEASRSESKREAADASAELVDVTAEKEKAEADVAALRKKVEEGKAKISTLRRDVQAARQSSAELAADADRGRAAALDALDKAEKEKGILESKLLEVQKTMGGVESERAALSESLSKLQGEMEVAAGETADKMKLAADRISKLQQVIAAQKRENEQVRGDLASAQHKLGESVRQSQADGEKSKALEQEIAALKVTLALEAKKLEKAGVDISSLREDAAARRSDVDALRAKLDEERGRTADAVSRLASAQGHKEAIEEARRQEKDELKKSIAEVSAAKKKIKKLESSLEEAVAMRTKWAGIKDGYEKSLGLAKEKIADAEERASKERARFEDLQQQIKTVVSERLQVQNSLQVTLKKLEEVTLELQNRLKSESAIKAKMAEREKAHKSSEEELSKGIAELKASMKEKDAELAKINMELSDSRRVGSECRRRLEIAEEKVKVMEQDAAKQVVAFKARCASLSEEMQQIEEDKSSLAEQLRNNKNLLANAVHTIEELRDEVQSGDADADSQMKKLAHDLKTMSAAREIAEAAAHNAETREAGLLSENKKLNRARQQADEKVHLLNRELLALQKKYDTVSRKLAQSRRDIENSRVIENSSANFLMKDLGKSTAGALPEIGSPRLVQAPLIKTGKLSTTSSSKAHRPESAPPVRRSTSSHHHAVGTGGGNKQPKR